jgi:hypothetical protein
MLTKNAEFVAQVTNNSAFFDNYSQIYVDYIIIV